MSLVCPICLSGLRHTADTCPSCGRVFRCSDWIPEAYSARYLRSRILFECADGKVHKGRWGEQAFFIGSKPGASGFLIESSRCKERHVRVSCDENEWIVCGEQDEFEADGKKYALGERTPIRPGTRIKIGSVIFTARIVYALPKISEDIPVSKTIEKPFTLSGDDVWIGSDYKCNFRIPGIEAWHARIYRNRRTGKWYLTNCSRRGTFLNGGQIHNVALINGDRISVAGTCFIFTSSALKPFEPSGLQLCVEKVNVTRGGKTILRDVSMVASPGEFIGVLGPSGCGKSSLIQRLVGLDCVDSGTIKINGKIFEECRAEFLSKTAYLPQQAAVHEDLTVSEEMRVFCDLHNVPSRQISEKLNLVGLQSESEKRVGTLSGGQQRRLGIALELLREPMLLVLDEPTSGLDPKTETEVMTYLRRVASQGKTVICSTHILENLDLFDKILVLAEGGVVFFDSPKRLFHTFGIKRPCDLYGKLDNENSIAHFAKKVVKTSVPAVSETFTWLTGKRSDSLQECRGYLKRMFYEFLSFRHAPNKVIGFLQSSLFIQLFVQPILIALAIKFSCAYKMTTVLGYKEVLFFCAISVFWLGLNNTIRELVRERVPWRCLERMSQVGSVGYLLSKLIWNGVVCLLQILIFAFWVYGMPRIDVVDSGGHEINFSAGIICVLFVTGFLGALIGLAISAFFKRENAAVSLLPIVLIPILFFSQPIVQDEEKKASSVASAIAEIMPCYDAQMIMHKIDGSKESVHAKEWRSAAPVPVLYVLFALGLMVYFQNKREREWNGR